MNPSIQQTNEIVRDSALGMAEAVPAARGDRWYILETRRNWEHTVAEQLTEHGIPCYVPRCLAVPGPEEAGRVETMFPGWVFGQLRLAQHYTFAIAIRNVRSLLACGAEPVTLADQAIRYLRSCERPDGLIACGKSPRRRHCIDPGLSSLTHMVNSGDLTGNERLSELMGALSQDARPRQSFEN